LPAHARARAAHVSALLRAASLPVLAVIQKIVMTFIISQCRKKSGRISQCRMKPALSNVRKQIFTRKSRYTTLDTSALP